MSEGMMALLGGVLVFLAALIPIIAGICRWVAQKGMQKVALLVCLLLAAVACYALGIVGIFQKWDLITVFSYLIGYVILYAATFALTAGVPSRTQIAVFVVAVSVQMLLMSLNETISRLGALQKKIDQLTESKAEATPVPK